MNSPLFSLRTFQSEGLLPALELKGGVKRLSNTLSVSYLLTGPVEELVLPGPAEVRLRKDGLWKETCFELFLGVRGSEGYWEFNLSPSGHWNVYHFSSYRQGMREETAFTSLPFSLQLHSNSLLLFLTPVLDNIIMPEQVLQAALTAVIKTREGKTIYWALAHPGPQPDFHRRDSFVIEL